MTDVTRGLLLEQPRGSAPLSTHLTPSGESAHKLNVRQLRKLNTKTLLGFKKEAL